MSGALEGLRVIDLTVWFQGPVAAAHLADFGAEVIHVERPETGDQGRGVRSIKALPVGDWNQYFLVINRNKKSLAVDLKKPEGQQIIYDLVKNSDVFLSNLGLASLEKMGFSHEKLAEINPKIIYATTTGYGYFGGIAKPSFDMTVQALTGLMSRLGEPCQPPIYLGMGSGDAYGGLMAALGIMLALYHRQQTGKGQAIDASLYGAQLFLAAPTLQAYLATRGDRFRKQQSRLDAPNPLWNRYQAKDRWLFLCAPNQDEIWSKLCAALGEEGLEQEPAFASEFARRTNARDLVERLDAIFARLDVAEWMQRLTAQDIVASPIGNLEEHAEDPGAWENRYFMDAHCEEVKREVKVRGMPVELSKTPGEVRSLGPELGQDTEMLLFEALGYDWDKIGELKAKGIIP